MLQQFKKHLLQVIIILNTLTNATSSFADSTTDKSKLVEYINKSSQSQNGFFKNSYFGLGIGKNLPAYSSQDNFSPGKYGLLARYSYIHHQEWVMSITANFKSLKQKDINENFALWSISHASKYLVRLYHPLYFNFGAEFIYLLPTVQDRMPLKRDKEFELEIGAGLVLGLSYITSKNSTLNFSINRWRGTKTSHFQGTEYSLALDFALN